MSTNAELTEIFSTLDLIAYTTPPGCSHHVVLAIAGAVSAAARANALTAIPEGSVNFAASSAVRASAAHAIDERRWQLVRILDELFE